MIRHLLSIAFLVRLLTIVCGKSPVWRSLSSGYGGSYIYPDPCTSGLVPGTTRTDTACPAEFTGPSAVSSSSSGPVGQAAASARRDTSVTTIPSVGKC